MYQNKPFHICATKYNGVDQMVTDSSDLTKGSAGAAVAVLAPHEVSAIITSTTTALNQQESILTLMNLQTPVRIIILNYSGETQEELRTLAVVSKRLNEDCTRPGIKWNIIPTIELSPLEHNGGHTTVNLF